MMPQDDPEGENEAGVSSQATKENPGDAKNIEEASDERNET